MRLEIRKNTKFGYLVNGNNLKQVKARKIRKRKKRHKKRYSR